MAASSCVGAWWWDLRTGKIWGFPTMTTDPYPFNALNLKPQTSHPFELGRFAFEDMDK